MFALLALAPQSALASDGVPLSPIGFSFSPSAPAPLKPDHPLYRRIALEQVADMPGVVGGKATLGLAGAAKRSSFEKALRETMNKLNMLATTDAEAKVRLSPRWIDMDAPFKISFSSRASVTMGWSLTRIDNGQLLFKRDITTAVQGRKWHRPYGRSRTRRIDDKHCLRLELRRQGGLWRGTSRLRAFPEF